ncbi:hypothetical protein GOODEAATRI_017899 [Goodea atripinnis]|uniref:Uncharacterized protein n=1 Tax=Goodea atripinnis TaxID=208336 RepID=A0ABV0NVJ1_9TELE
MLPSYHPVFILCRHSLLTPTSKSTRVTTNASKSLNISPPCRTINLPLARLLQPVLRLSLCIFLPRSLRTPVTLNPICVSQPCSLTEKKKSRVGSVVMPYILSSTLRRMSTASTLSSTSSGLSSGSVSSDGPSSQEFVPQHTHITLIYRHGFFSSITQCHLSLFVIHFSASISVPRVIH